jgi:hypoxanthine-guanine phosphoribosyltransferase
MRRRLAITEPFIPANVDVLLTVEEVQARVAALADRLAPIVSQGSWTGVVTLMGAVPFAADLLRALAARGVDLGFDALWLESYHDERVSSQKWSSNGWTISSWIGHLSSIIRKGTRSGGR